MKILQLCNKPPIPAVDGGCIAMNTITQGLLKAGHEVKILTIETQKHPALYQEMPEAYKTKTRIESVFIDTSVNLVDAFSALVTSDSYNVSRFFSPDYDRRLVQILSEEQFDIIHLESLFMTPYIATIRRHSKAPIVLRSHNLEYIIWERMAEVSRNQAKKAYLKLLARQLKKYEMQVINTVDGIAAISGEDAKKYHQQKCKKPIINLAFGINLSGYKPVELQREQTTVFHIGSMDWTPNIEGIDWFLKMVWPIVQKKNPQLKLHLAGRKMPSHLNQYSDQNVVIDGEVSDAKEFINQHCVMVVPLLTAGGMRVKIIEAMAMKKAIVSTRIGAEGIDYEKGKHLLIADEPEQFADAILSVTSQPECCKELGTSARRLVEEHYDNEVLTEKLIGFYHTLLKK
ncbi:MAG: glycosyltransferase family 4 protein [Flavobacteriales bacterium]|nr:glycosyltransferase family 4 protein [Flavobacteriales bacterium]